MRETHPRLASDLAPDEPLWRYMNLPKFIALLQKDALWFSRSDLLSDTLQGTGYGGGEFGLAIRSDVGRLDSALPKKITGTNTPDGGVPAAPDAPPEAGALFRTGRIACTG